MAGTGKGSVFVVTAIGLAVVDACGSSTNNLVGHGPRAPDASTFGDDADTTFTSMTGTCSTLESDSKGRVVVGCGSVTR
jgi:hypothetical protein